MRPRMERLGRALCRTDHPIDDAGVMRRCADAWAVALEAMRSAGDAAPAEVARLFDGMCRWRAHRTRWTATGPRGDRRVATHYLLEAAARLSLMDYVHSAGDADVARRAAEVRDVCAVSLAEAEAVTMLQPFDAVSAEGLPALLEAVTSKWREPGSAQRERAALAPAAHALLVSSDSESISMAARTSLLVRAARVSTLCAAREILRAITIHHAATPVPIEGDAAAAIAAWARARAVGTHSEMAAKVPTLPEVQRSWEGSGDGLALPKESIILKESWGRVSPPQESIGQAISYLVNFL